MTKNRTPKPKLPKLKPGVPLTEKQEGQLTNSLNDLACNLYPMQGMPGQSAALSQTAPLYANLRWYLVTTNRQLLSELYVEHGVVQTLVDQPVDDAFRGGFDIKTDQLDADEIEQLQNYLEQYDVVRTLTQALKWARLFGGGAVIIQTGDDDPSTPLDVTKIKETTPILFKAADRWELTGNYPMDVNPNLTPSELKDENKNSYTYYGIQVHPSRVLRINGKEAPSLTRPRLQGWGMSEMERLVRSINQYVKNQDVVYELIDEAKVDVYKIAGFNSALMNDAGTYNVQKRIQAANMVKNYNKAITMDVKDEYEQKQITFAGLSDILTQIRQGLAADCKMPMTKLFGLSAAGFNSGEDDIENYNSMVDGEVRAKSKYKAIHLMKICCQKLFGFVPDDLSLEWHALRVMSAEQEENIKEKQFNRVMQTWQNGLSDDDEVVEQINTATLLPASIDVKAGMGEPRGALMKPDMGTNDRPDKKDKSKKDDKKK